mgnify:CR=1 FL=1
MARKKTNRKFAGVKVGDASCDRCGAPWRGEKRWKVVNGRLLCPRHAAAAGYDPSRPGLYPLEDVTITTEPLPRETSSSTLQEFIKV